MTEILVFYFHQVTKIRQASKSTSLLKRGDDILVDNDDIEQHALQYYSSLYATSNDCVQNGFIQSVVLALVSQQDNDFLTKMP